MPDEFVDVFASLGSEWASAQNAPRGLHHYEGRVVQVRGRSVAAGRWRGSFGGGLVVAFQVVGAGGVGMVPANAVVTVGAIGLGGRRRRHLMGHNL